VAPNDDGHGAGAHGSGRVAHCVDNPHKAGLVEDAEHWPRLYLCYGLGDADDTDFE
jgi:hypothetical protein